MAKIVQMKTTTKNGSRPTVHQNLLSIRQCPSSSSHDTFLITFSCYWVLKAVVCFISWVTICIEICGYGREIVFIRLLYGLNCFHCIALIRTTIDRDRGKKKFINITYNIMHVNCIMQNVFAFQLIYCGLVHDFLTSFQQSNAFLMCDDARSDGKPTTKHTQLKCIKNKHAQASTHCTIVSIVPMHQFIDMVVNEARVARTLFFVLFHY